VHVIVEQHLRGRFDYLTLEARISFINFSPLLPLSCFVLLPRQVKVVYEVRAEDLDVGA